MFESRLADILTSTLRSEADRLAEELRQRGPEAAQDPLVWAAQQERLRQAIMPVLLELAERGVQEAIKALGDSAIGVDWNLANQNAAAWAREYAGELITRVTDTTRQRVAEQVAQWAESAEGLPGLVDRIADLKDDQELPIFNRQRADLIASTESTNAYAAANTQAWETAGYPSVVFRPAAHPRCRCYAQPKRLADGTKLIVWYTARDELVCTRPIATPWGNVNGCRDLHQVVISTGPYLGKKLSEVQG